MTKFLLVLVPCGSLAGLLYLIHCWRQPFADVRPGYGAYFPRPKSVGTLPRKVFDGDKWIVLHDEER